MLSPALSCVRVAREKCLLSSEHPLTIGGITGVVGTSLSQNLGAVLGISRVPLTLAPCRPRISELLGRHGALVLRALRDERVPQRELVLEVGQELDLARPRIHLKLGDKLHNLLALTMG